jgi:hypothetical protein
MLQRYVADISGPLTETGNVRGRVIAVHDEKDHFQQSRQERKDVLYGVMAFDLNDSTTLTTGLEWTQLDATGAWGNLPADYDGSPLPFGRSTYLGADWNRWNRSNLQTFAELEHRFDNDWTLKLMAQRTHFELDDNGQADLLHPRHRGRQPQPQPLPDELPGHRGRWRREPAEQPQRHAQRPVRPARAQPRADARRGAHPQRLLCLGHQLRDLRGVRHPHLGPENQPGQPGHQHHRPPGAHPHHPGRPTPPGASPWPIRSPRSSARANWYDYEQENNTRPMANSASTTRSCRTPR